MGKHSKPGQQHGRATAFIAWQQEQGRARTAGLSWAKGYFITIKHNVEGQKGTGSCLGCWAMAAWRRAGYRLVGDKMLHS